LSFRTRIEDFDSDISRLHRTFGMIPRVLPAIMLVVIIPDLDDKYWRDYEYYKQTRKTFPQGASARVILRQWRRGGVHVREAPQAEGEHAALLVRHLAARGCESEGGEGSCPHRKEASNKTEASAGGKAELAAQAATTEPAPAPAEVQP
jgi:hypothetical protein